MAVQYLTYTPQTDEELKKTAELKWNDYYDAALTGATRAAEGLINQTKGRIASLDPQYESAAQQVGSTYDAQRKQLQQSALDRGFGRSSYVTDRMAKSYELQDTALQQLQAEKISRVDQLESAIETLYGQLLEDQNHLSLEKANKILATIDDMRREQEAALRSVTTANNDLYLRETAAADARERYQRDYDLAVQRMNQEANIARENAMIAQQQRQQDAYYKQMEYQLRLEEAQRSAQMAQIEQALRTAELASKQAALQQASPYAASYAPTATTASTSGSKTSASAGTTFSSSKSASTSTTTYASAQRYLDGLSSQQALYALNYDPQYGALSRSDFQALVKRYS